MGEYTQDDLTFIISTMNKSDEGFLNYIFVDIPWDTLNIIVVNQTNKNEIHRKNKISWINDKAIGLSKSRNLGKKYLNTKIGVIVDDDQIIKSKHILNILYGYNNLNPDFITFKIWSFTNDFKKYKSQIFKHNKYSILNVSSIEITAKKEVLKQINFDQNFGLGSKFKTGEEIIFLKDCIDYNFNGYFFPKHICEHPKETSSSIFTNKMKLYKLKMFERIYGIRLGRLMFFFFFIKQFIKNFTNN